MAGSWRVPDRHGGAPFPRHATHALLALLIAAAPLPATAGEKAVWTLDVENDFFSRWANDDRDFTNGFKLTWTSSAIEDLSRVPDWARNLASWPSLLGPSHTGREEQRITLALGQSLFTPGDKVSRGLVRDDRPYASWLYGAVSMQTTHRWGDDPVRQDTLQLEIGMIGPAALGRATQNNFHDLIGGDRSNGWSNQLRNEPGVNLVVEQRYRLGKERLPLLGLEGDLIPYLGASLGNVSTYAGLGATFRIGEDLGNDFGPPRIRPSLPGSEAFSSTGDFGWYLFAGAGVMVVGRNIFLDGNTFRDSHSVTREIIVGDFQLGFALFWRDLRLTYTHVIRSPEFREQARPHQFGAISISKAF